MPRNITISKTTTLVISLSKLHNFCIDEADELVGEIIAQHENNIIMSENGVVPLVPNTDVVDVLAAESNAH